MMPTSDIDYSVNYYEVLEVQPSASSDEIHRSFRRLVLESHPDKNPERREWSERRIKELIKANDVLSDDEKRRRFDSVRRLSRAKPARKEPFFFRKRGPGSRALLILHLLLNDRPAEAAELLIEQEQEHGKDFLIRYLERNDYLDALFLLAEHHLAKKEYERAADRLMAFYRQQRGSKYRRHYYDEVIRMLKDLYLRKLPRVLQPEDALNYLDEAEDLQLNQKEKLQRLQKLAETHARLGDRTGAAQATQEIQDLDPKFDGLDRLQAFFD